MVTTFHDDVENRARSKDAFLEAFQMLKRQLPIHKETLKDSMAEVRRFIQDKQRDINRKFEPQILDHMKPVYETCAAERGTGSFARMKNCMDRHIEQEKSAMFEDAVEHVRQLMNQMLEELKNTFLHKVQAMLVTIERDYTGIIVEQQQAQDQAREQRLVQKAVLEFVDGAETVFKRTAVVTSDFPSE
jgi:hypothetical protein